MLVGIIDSQELGGMIDVSTVSAKSDLQFQLIPFVSKEGNCTH